MYDRIAFEVNGGFWQLLIYEISFFQSPDSVGIVDTSYFCTPSQRVETARAYPRPIRLLPSFSLRIMKIHRGFALRLVH